MIAAPQRNLALCALMLTLLLPQKLRAQPDPATCLSTGHTSISVEWEGRLFHLTSEECRALFASDPERYGQLFEVLAEVDAPPPVTSAASLVPS